MRLTAAIISRSKQIDGLVLDSLSFADEVIIVIDGEGKDVAEGKIKYFYHSLNDDFAQQRNYAISRAKGDWVLFVDADEIVSTELAREIKENIDGKYSGYYLPRVDIVFHQPLRFGETGKIKILRLAKRDAGKFTRPVHEKWQVRGRVGELKSPLYHIKDNFIGEFMGRMNQYGQQDAIILNREKKPFSYFRFFMNPLAKFILNYVFLLGFLDGYPGLFQAYLMSIQSLSVRVFQWTDRNVS